MPASEQSVVWTVVGSIIVGVLGLIGTIYGIVTQSRRAKIEVSSAEGTKIVEMLLRERTEREADMRHLRAEIDALRKELDSKDEQLMAMRTKRHQTNNALTAALARESELERKNAELSLKVAALETRVAELEARL